MSSLCHWFKVSRNFRLNSAVHVWYPELINQTFGLKTRDVTHILHKCTLDVGHGRPMMTCYGLSYVDNCSLLIFLIVCVCVSAAGSTWRSTTARVRPSRKPSERKWNGWWADWCRVSRISSRRTWRFGSLKNFNSVTLNTEAKGS